MKYAISFVLYCSIMLYLCTPKEGEEVFYYDEAEVKPEYSEGMDAFYSYIKENVYPEEARKDSIEGSVMIEFVIDPKGAYKSVKILKGLGACCDQYMIDNIKASKTWKPGYFDRASAFKNSSIKRLFTIQIFNRMVIY